MKNVIKLDVYYSPMELEAALNRFVHYYNYERYLSRGFFSIVK
jgi:hypothetical protein